MSKPKIQHCDKCRFGDWNSWWEAGCINIKMECRKGHRPRFYAPTSNPLDDCWGYKRRCEDFEPFEEEK